MSSYSISIVQLNRTAYFWVLKKDGEPIARSRKIEEKSIIEVEADEVGKDFGLQVFVEER